MLKEIEGIRLELRRLRRVDAAGTGALGHQSANRPADAPFVAVRRVNDALVRLGMALALLALTGCAALEAATARPGARPGVDVPRDGGDRSAVRLGTPALAPAGQGGYSFLATRPDGTPVTFDPCRVVHVAVRPDHQPAGGAEILASALADLGAATGLQFVDDGATDEPPDENREPYQPQRYGDRWAPVLVTWSTPTETPLLTDGVLGRAGPHSFGTGLDDMRYVSGAAVFNGPALEAQLRGGEREKARAVLLHELGHLVGLGHVTDPYQVMYDTNSYPLPTYRSGDLRGLEQLGLGRCFQDY